MNRRTLRRRVLHELGDLRLLTATDAGDPTTFIDTVNLWGEPGHYAGRLAYVSGGTPANLGQMRQVKGSSQQAMSLTLVAPLPAATAAGDEIELVNTFGMGWTFENIHHAINATIDEARDAALVPLTADSAEAFDQDGDRTVAIPAEWAGVERVQVIDETSGHLINVRRAGVIGANGWAINHADRTLLINGEQARAAHNRIVRLYGYGYPPPLATDDDETGVDPEWLFHRVCSRMLLNTVRSRQGADWTGQGLWHADEAKSLRARLTPNFGPSFTRI